jgi:hypothetical protein
MEGRPACAAALCRIPEACRRLRATPGQHVLAIINETVDAGSPYQARKLLALIRKLFGWAVARGSYGLESSPCSLIKPADVIGKLAVRQRVFDDNDWRAFWKASAEIGYPFGPLFPSPRHDRKQARRDRLGHLGRSGRR